MVEYEVAMELCALDILEDLLSLLQVLVIVGSRHMFWQKPYLMRSRLSAWFRLKMVEEKKEGWALGLVWSGYVQ